MIMTAETRGMYIVAGKESAPRLLRVVSWEGLTAYYVARAELIRWSRSWLTRLPIDAMWNMNATAGTWTLDVGVQRRSCSKYLYSTVKTPQRLQTILGRIES